MLSSLASLLLLGTISVAPARQPIRLPSLQTVGVAAPAEKVNIDLSSITASGVLLVDLTSGQELASREADTPRPMASLTKLMTALWVTENLDMNDVVVIPPFTDGIAGSSLHLKPGTRYRVGELLKGMLIPSANDAAYALGIHSAGSTEAFAEKMNQRAAALGLKETHFENAAGLDVETQMSSPRNLAWLATAILRKPNLKEIISTRYAQVKGMDGNVIGVRNTNELLHEDSRVIGMKTGTTSKAGECLIVAFIDGGRTYLLVLLKSHDRYTDALRILSQFDAVHR